MKRLLALLILLLPLSAHAALNVFACEPEWAALARELGGNDVKVYSAITAMQDPHRIEARPSLIAQMRRADLVVCTGAELEIGWLPILLRDAGNAGVQPGQPGYFEATRFVTLMEKPTRLDRADGDVHASGNPHIHTDPRNIQRVSEALAARLIEIDPAHAAAHRARGVSFSARWNAAMTGWQTRAEPLKGLPVVVQHKSFSYLLNWLEMRTLATLEPKPGVEPSVGYLASVAAQLQETPAKLVLRAAYQSPRPADWLAQRAGIPALALPYTVGGSKRASDLFGLFDDTLDQLLKVAP
ncbi:MAG: zinc ABC transporter substrate-binding protein [Thiobacillus sp.]|nr:zinc ABC transporter substrate-binding protein [Thiobacillus sp.]